MVASHSGYEVSFTLWICWQPHKAAQRSTSSTVHHVADPNMLAFPLGRVNILLAASLQQRYYWYVWLPIPAVMMSLLSESRSRISRTHSSGSWSKLLAPASATASRRSSAFFRCSMAAMQAIRRLSTHEVSTLVPKRKPTEVSAKLLFLLLFSHRFLILKHFHAAHRHLCEINAKSNYSRKFRDSTK